MSLTTLLCHVTVGFGTVTLYPGIIETPRYDDTEVRIVLDGDRLTDITVNGPYDKQFSYVAHGYVLTSVRLADRLLLEVRGEGMNALRETLIVTDRGQLIWTQLGNADALRASSASLFIGTCE